MEHSWILIVAMIGHVLCVYADRLLLCTPGSQFSFSDMKDNARMTKLFGAKSDSDSLRSIVLQGGGLTPTLEDILVVHNASIRRKSRSL